jgi:hypothetical protein
VSLQFQYIFTGKRIGAGEKQGYALIEYFTLSAGEIAVMGVTRLEGNWEQLLRDPFSFGAGDANYADTTTASGSGYGDDGVGIHHSVT